MAKPKNKEPRFRCPFCGFTSNLIRNIKQHVTRKHIQEISRCPVCNKKMKTSRIKSALVQHLKSQNDYEHMSFYYLIHTYNSSRNDSTGIQEGKKYKYYFSLF